MDFTWQIRVISSGEVVHTETAAGADFPEAEDLVGEHPEFMELTDLLDFHGGPLQVEAERPSGQTTTWRVDSVNGQPSFGPPQ